MVGLDWKRRNGLLWLILMGIWLLASEGIPAEAGPLYVYTDAQGQPVLTDNLEQVPAAYKGRVRTMTGPDSPVAQAAEPVAAPPVAHTASKGVVEDLLDAVAGKLGHRAIKGLTTYQTAVTIVAGSAAVALLLMMLLSANPGIRILCKFLLVLVAGAALYHLAAFDAPSLEAVAGPPQQGSGKPVDNVLGRLRSQTEQSYRAQDERTARQVEPVESSTR
ncbi:MAG: hypothetical protein JSR62_10485 [Nitrospira sp.]|nr:hypothetical protein [Nitrospira sp.]